MSGRPDYDVGDLVVCLKNGTDYPFRKGSVYLCRAILPPDVNGEWGVLIKDMRAPDEPVAGWLAAEFRKLDPKPPEFWTQDIEADTPQKVTA